MDDDLTFPLVRRATLTAEGVSSLDIRHQLSRGELQRVRRGWYARSDDADRFYAEQRHLRHIEAVAQAMRGDGAAFSHISAAVAHGLPLYRADTHRVHMTMRHGRRSGTTSDMARHRDALSDEEIELRGHLLCTSLTRTVVDVARTSPPEAALCVADAAMRSLAWNDRRRTYDDAAAEQFRAGLRDCLGRMPSRRGAAKAREILSMADGRAQLPGESVSRWRLKRLGFARPRVQVAIAGPGTSCYFVDLGLDDVQRWGEFDGKDKYRDPVFLAGRTPERALWDEKQREDWIRGTTGRSFVRWAWEHIHTTDEFERRLRAFGLVAPIRRGVVLGPGW